MTARRPPGFSAAARLLTMASGCVRWWYASRIRIASQQRAGRFGRVRRALEDCHVREPFALRRIAQRRQLGRSDVGGIHAARRSDDFREPHRPGAEPRAHVGDRHARLQLEELRKLGQLELGSFDLPFGQARLLCSNREEQQKNENERTGDASHDWPPVSKSITNDELPPLRAGVSRRRIGIMSYDPLDVDLDKPVDEEPRDIKPRSGKALMIAVAAGLALALALGYIVFACAVWSAHSCRPHSSTLPKAVPNGRAEPGDQIPLPPLDETDALVRQLIAQLSSNPTVAAWLTTDGLLANFALVHAADCQRRKPHRRSSQRLDPCPRSACERHEMICSSIRRAIGATTGTLRLCRRLMRAARRGSTPRSSRAFSRHTGGWASPRLTSIPFSNERFVELLSVPAVQGEIELAPSGIVYAFVDPKLENMSAAQKHLLRMGPENVRAIQGKLREIADYLGIPAARLPRPSV